MIRFTHFLALVLLTCLAACSSTPSLRIVATPIHQGMTSAQLLAAFGRPNRVQPNPNGGEDWFYNFGSQQHESHPVSEATVSETERSYSAGHTTSTTTIMNEAPVHLSPSGRVVGSIPTGRVVVK